MSRVFLLTTLAGALLLGGCAAPPPANYMPQDIEFSQTHLNAELKSISVSFPADSNAKIRVRMAQSNSQTSAVAADMRTNFKDALEEAINRSGVFADAADTRVNVFAQLLDLQMPSMGISFPTTTVVHYKIQRRSDGAYVYDKEIKAVGESAISDAMGVNRALSAVNVSYQNNIKAFIEDLRKLAEDPANPFR